MPKRFDERFELGFNEVAKKMYEDKYQRQFADMRELALWVRVDY